MKLHELLAAESNLDGQYNKTRAEIASTFYKKRHLFEEKKVVFTPISETGVQTTESQSDIQTTVKKELTWVSGHIQKALDAGLQVADANTRAKADVVLEDDAQTTILKDVPATALLELEKRAVEIQQLISAIPTLDPAKGFALDQTRGDGIYKAREINKTRTKKDVKVIVKYEATEKHPAQTELINVDVPIGTVMEQEWSGLITPTEKSAMLDRADQFIRAVRKARSRANDVEVDITKKIGNRILKFIIDNKV